MSQHLQCHLWRLTNITEAEATAAIFQERGIMRVACLADGSAWALVQPEQLARLQVCTFSSDYETIKYLHMQTCWGSRSSRCRVVTRASARGRKFGANICCLCAQGSCPLAADVHAELLERYHYGFTSLADVPDDGYFLQARA